MEEKCPKCGVRGEFVDNKCPICDFILDDQSKLLLLQKKQSTKKLIFLGVGAFVFVLLCITLGLETTLDMFLDTFLSIALLVLTIYAICKIVNASMIGESLIIVGIILFSISFIIDTAREGVHNIGLLNTKQNMFIFSSVIFLAGIIVTCFKRFSNNKKD